MKSLVFRELWILSKAEKAGVNLSLGPNMNLLIGENDVGKSTLIKSIYHCLGADTPQISAQGNQESTQCCGYGA